MSAWKVEGRRGAVWRSGCAPRSDACRVTGCHRLCAVGDKQRCHRPAGCSSSPAVLCSTKGAGLPKRVVNSESQLPSIARGLGGRRPLGVDLDGPAHSTTIFDRDLNTYWNSVYGWHEGDGKPLLHTKLLVLGDVRVITIDPGCAPEFEEVQFVPQQVWLDSANWTARSKLHQEFGLACRDPC